jgi:hypothetical protein
MEKMRNACDILVGNPSGKFRETARGSVVVKALFYKPKGRGFET